MKRRTLLFGAITGIAATSVSRLQADEPAHHRPMPFTLDAPVDLEIKSAPVVWKEREYHLVQIHRVLFSLEKETSRLTAKLSGLTNTFDNVEYDVCGAVFGANGELLGSARSKCEVTRRWAGKPIGGSLSLDLDFGISQAFVNAKTFLLGVSERPVLTPDQWQ